MGRHRGPRRPTDAEIGYCKPPVARRFKPGRSGNPNGRPKGARSKAVGLYDIIMRELQRKYPTANGEKVSAEELLTKRLIRDGINGKSSALKLAFELLQRIDADLRMVEAQTGTAANDDDEAIVQNFIARYRGAGQQLNRETYRKPLGDADAKGTAAENAPNIAAQNQKKPRR